MVKVSFKTQTQAAEVSSKLITFEER